jgi:hypothetical protein
MGVFNTAVVTSRGQALLTKVLAGACEMRFTKIALSDNVPTGDLTAISTLTSIRQSEKLSEIVKKGSSVICRAGFTNVGITTGYYVKAIGLYAMDPDEGEILYSISTADESVILADWMPPLEAGNVISIIIDVITALANTDVVNLDVDPTAFVTAQQFNPVKEASENHFKDHDNPHGTNAEKVGAVAFDYTGGILGSIPENYLLNFEEGIIDVEHDYPFTYAKIFSTHGAEGTPETQYAFAVDGKVYIRKGTYAGKFNYENTGFTAWEEIDADLRTAVGEFSTALDELHAYAQALINGGATE